MAQQNMKGKVCIVTGGNSGIGYQSALSLAEMGAEVTLVCRNQVKGQQAADHIQHATQNPVRLLLADLSDLAQVQRVSQEITQLYPRVDVLLNNAGAYFPHFMPSAQGYEMTCALNHLSYFLLTHHLLPLLQASDQGRIVNVASRAHRTAQLDLTDLHFRNRSYRPFVVYGTSKLMNILFTRHLADELKSTPERAHITANCLHPGVVRTGFGQDYKSVFAVLAYLAGPLFISAKKGAETSIYLASHPDVSEISGAYFSKCKAIQPKPWAQDDQMAAQLWDISVELCKDFM